MVKYKVQSEYIYSVKYLVEGSKFQKQRLINKIRFWIVLVNYVINASQLPKLNLL